MLAKREKVKGVLSTYYNEYVEFSFVLSCNWGQMTQFNVIFILSSEENQTQKRSFRLVISFTIMIKTFSPS